MRSLGPKPILTVLALTIAISGLSQIDRCEDCELMFEGMPSALSSTAQISGPADRGEVLTISGTIFQPDGKTPATSVILYIYHTDKAGKYTPSREQVHGKRHGHLRGWIKTDERGHYTFSTIRPASYPNSTNPQHIHPIVKEPSRSYYWIDDFLFDDDALLTEKQKNNQQQRGGSGILSLKKNDKGVWIGKRNIVLGKNIPGYR